MAFCRNCATELQAEWRVCPKCGTDIAATDKPANEPVPQAKPFNATEQTRESLLTGRQIRPGSFGSKTWHKIAVGFVGACIALIVYSAIAGDPPDTSTAPAGTNAIGVPDAEEPAATQPPARARGIGNGTHQVGSDIQPGTYRAANVEGSCYWARLKGLSGSFQDILANDNSTGPTVVEIKPTDAAFQSRDCGGWLPLGAGILPQRNSFGEGTFVVGLDFDPGTYRTPGAGESCYWARLRNLGGAFDAIIANENTEGPSVVQISPSDKGFTSRGCGTWTKS